MTYISGESLYNKNGSVVAGEILVRSVKWQAGSNKYIDIKMKKKFFYDKESISFFVAFRNDL